MTVNLTRRATVRVSIRRGLHVAARTRPRLLPAGRRTVHFRLSRRLAPGRTYAVRMVATIAGRPTTRTRRLRVIR